MGTSQICIFCHRNTFLIFSIILLLASSFTTNLAEGRAITKLIETNQMGTGAAVSSLIGSRPPKCDRKCVSCKHCEAVQVPVTTQAQGHRRNHFFSQITNSRGDDISNYKPMSWKCKCGNMFFNP